MSQNGLSQNGLSLSRSHFGSSSSHFGSSHFGSRSGLPVPEFSPCNPLPVCLVSMGDVTMNDDDATQPMQAFDVDADESPLHSVKPDLAAVSLAMEDRRAQTDALRDAARAALAAATNDNLVLPVPGLNPYQQNALGAPPPPTTLAPLRKEGKGPKDRLESPEKKTQDRENPPRGLGAHPFVRREYVVCARCCP